MQGDIRTVASHLNIIQTPEQIEAAKAGELFVDSRRVLLIKNFPAAKAAELIYREFAVRRDLRGGRFHVSHRQKCLVAKDQWDQYSRVGIEDFRQYVQHWFQLADLGEYDGKPALILVKSLPAMSVPLYCQGRYITKALIDLFPAVD